MTKRTIVEVVVAIIVIAAFFLVSVFKWEKGEEYLVKYTPVVIAVTSVVDKLISDDTTSDTLAIIDAAMKTAKEQFEKEYNRPPDNKELNQLKDIVTELLRLKKLPGEYDSDLSSQGP